jgi:hypothetical protein
MFDCKWYPSALVTGSPAATAIERLSGFTFRFGDRVATK